MSKFFKVILVALVLFVNLAVAQPSLAGKDFTKGADYAEVTQELNQLLSAQSDPSTAGYTPEQYQQRLSELQMQKYVMETAKKRAQCRNATGQTLAVYANKPKKLPTQLYFLAAGEITDDDWDCDGIYVPAGTQATLGPAAQPASLAEPVAIKVVDGTQLIATTNPQPKFKNEEWAFSWSLPYYVDQGFLIVGSLDPQRYIFEQSKWRLIFTPHDIQMYILSEWLDAGWMPAQPLRNAPFWWSLQ